MNAEKLTLEGLQEALLVEFGKGKDANLEEIKALSAQLFGLVESDYTANDEVPNLEDYISKETVESDYTPNSEIDSMDELLEKVADLENELAQEQAKKLNPHEAKLMQINGGKSIETLNITNVDSDGKVVEAFKVSARFSRPSFSVPNHGKFNSKDVVANPQKHTEVIQQLIERKSSVLVIESSKKLTKKELESLNKKS